MGGGSSIWGLENKGTAYQKEVIQPGDRASKLAKEICFQSHGNCPAVIIIPHQPGNFRGAVGFVWKKHILKQMMDYVEVDGEIKWSMLEEVENDGAGGKPQFFSLVGVPEVFWNLGWEIITMVADDFARSGRFPAIMCNDINAKRITEKNFHLFQTMMGGYGQALKESGLVNITGEVAIMKHSITGFCDAGDDGQLILTWGGSCIGLGYKDFLIDGSGIEPHMPIIGFWEPGYRCNGGTRLTELILETWGPEIGSVLKNADAVNFAHKLCIPSQSYAKTITRLVGWKPDGSIGEPLTKVHGIAHITGGGLWEKFGEILPQGIGADLRNMPPPADVLLEAQRLSWKTERPISDWECHSTFHGGCGAMLVVDEGGKSAVLKKAKEDGILAQVVGRTVSSSKNEIFVDSKFLQKRKRLSSLEPE